MPVRIELFGAPRISIDREPLAFNRTRGLALLAHLAASDVPVSRDALLALLWPDFATADARNGLRRELSLLRSHLGEEALLADRSLVSLSDDPDLLWIDLREFQRLVDRVRDHSEAAEQLCDRCVADLEAAVVLYTDDFLAGFTMADSPAFDEWQLYQTERLRRSYGLVLATLMDWHIAHGAYDRAIVYGRQRHSLDPSDEPGSRSLMRLLAWSGQTTAALREYEQLRQHLHDEFGIEPDSETHELHEKIRSRRLDPPRMQVPQGAHAESTSERQSKYANNLPADTTPFVGREQELAQLDQLMANPAVRLITIIGPGGMGKTRLAIAAAARKAGLFAANESAFSDGVFFVSLAPVPSPADIVPTLGRVLGFSFEGQVDQERQLIEFLRYKQALLVFDNYEHLLDETSAGFPARILEGAPEVKIIVTSRTRLGSRSEHLFALSGFETLDLPVLAEGLDGEDMQASFNANPAIALFELAVQRLQPDFKVTAANVSDVARITHLVGGMPLGIELAAGWSEMYSPTEIVAEIGASLDFLQADMAGVPERQMSLRAVFDTSWQRLTDEERRTLASLSVFRGGFERRAAETVVGTSARMLMPLANKSWLQRVGEHRLQIHELLRQYAEEQLRAEETHYTAAGERHAAFYAAYTTELELGIKGPEFTLALATFAADLENILASWRWLVSHGRLGEAVEQMLPGLLLYAEARFDYGLLLTAVEPAMAALRAAGEFDTNIPVRVALEVAELSFYDNGWPARHFGYEFSDPQTRSRLLGLRQLAKRGAPAPLWQVLAAYLTGMYAEYAAGRDWLEELVTASGETLDPWTYYLSRQLLGALISSLEDKTAALAPDDDPRWNRPRSGDRVEGLLNEALEGFRKIGAVYQQAMTQASIGFHYEHTGRVTLATEHLQRASEIISELGEVLLASSWRYLLGGLAMTAGNFAGAFDFYRQAADAFIDQGRARLAVLVLTTESYDALRYSTPEHAFETRQRLLAISSQLGNALIRSWDLWEMGEIYRFTGDFASAREYYAQARQLFSEIDHEHGIGFYHRGLGDVAHGEGDFAGALEHFDRYLVFARIEGDLWSMIYASRGLGDAALGLGNLSLARDHLVETLRYCYQRLITIGDLNGIYLAAFGAVARLFYAAGLTSDAGELASYVVGHRLTWNETRRDLERLSWAGPVEMRKYNVDRALGDIAAMCRKLQLHVDELLIPD